MFGSMYPNILREWNLLSRQVDKNGCKAFAEMVQTRMDIKAKLHDESISKEEKKNLKDQAARYKLILNTTSGCMKDKFKKIYDPEYNTKMCALGQMALTDLIYRLNNRISKETGKDIILVNSNTDGIALEINKDDDITEKLIDEVAHEWEKDWHFTLEKTIADNLYQKDVNNYVFKDKDGKVKVKGAYVTKYDEGNEQDTLAILAKAVVDYFLEGIDVKETIINPDNLATDYQMIKKLGNMYDTPTWKKTDIFGKETNEIVQKVNRIFASTNNNFGSLYKHKKSKDIGTLDKVEGTPEHLLIYNEDIRGKKIGELNNIDYNWYIAEAQQRINDFLRDKKSKERRKIKWMNYLKN